MQIVSNMCQICAEPKLCILSDESSKSLKSHCCRFNKSFGEKVDGLIEHQSGPWDLGPCITYKGHAGVLAYQDDI